MIPITKPHIFDTSKKYINRVLNSNFLTDGKYQKLTENLIKKKLKSKFIAVTQSCTSALEITSILLDLKPNDEVILPSYGFVSLANSIIMRGAKPIFAEIDKDTLNICPKDVEKKISKKTKAIYIIHYAGHSCDMQQLLKIKKKYNLFLVEDSAHAFLGKYKNKFLGTIGDIGTFSFHETKNFVSGQGGCISINNKKLFKRIDFLLDKGTNRKKFIKDSNSTIIKSFQVRNYYSWVDIGSEYRSPEIPCALLFSQLEKSQVIQKKREEIWKKYKLLFNKINHQSVKMIEPIKNSVSSYHLLVLIFENIKLVNEFKKFLHYRGIAATFHYVPLHQSKMGKKFKKQKLPVTENIYKKIVRLPLYSSMSTKDFKKIKTSIEYFFSKIKS